MNKVIKEAREHLYEICKDRTRFRMCVPVQKTDSDEIFSRAFDYAERLEKRLGRKEERTKEDIAKLDFCYRERISLGGRYDILGIENEKLKSEKKILRECIELIISQGGTDVIVNGKIENCALLCIKEIGENESE